MMDLVEDGGETVSILRKGVSDWAGDSGEFDFSHKVYNVLFEHDSNVYTSRDRREDSVTNGKVYMPLGSDVKSTDRIERADGSIVRVIGRPVPYNFGLVSGIGFRYREVSGG